MHCLHEEYFCAFSWFIYTTFVEFLGVKCTCVCNYAQTLYVFGMIFPCMHTLDKQRCEAMRKPAQTISKTRGKPPTVSSGT